MFKGRAKGIVRTSIAIVINERIKEINSIKRPSIMCNTKLKKEEEKSKSYKRVCNIYTDTND